MNSAVVRGEVRLLLRDPAVWTVLLVLVVTLIGAVIQGVLRKHAEIAVFTEMANADAARLESATWDAIRLEEQGGNVSRFRDPRNADVVGRRLAVQHLILPPTGLAALAVGQSDLHPAWHPVSLEPRDQLLAEGELNAPRQLAVGRFDVSFVVVFVAPLLLLGLLAGSPARERESGILPLLAVQRGRLGGWLALRTGLRLLIVLLPILVVGVVVAWLPGPGPLETAASETWLRLGLWGLAVAGYLTFWAALGVWMGTLALDTARAVLALAAAWLLLVILLPAIANVALELSYPQPSRIEYVDAMRAATDLARAEGSEVLQQYLEDHPEMAGDDVDVDDFFAQRLLVQARVEEALRPLSTAFEQQRQARARQVRWLRWASPAMLTSEGLADAAGTSESRQADFLQQVHGFHDAWRDFFGPRVLAGRPFFDHDRIPTFEYSHEPPTRLAARMAVVMLGCFGLSVALGLLALRRARSLPKVMGNE
ncbi:MAG: DUF3526 domain-containing protein [Gammaproteobacteria bacterium]|nr:MAG: DUF3526 domain-containing protein [Gammaproteobacteria bacterium]